MSGQIYLNKYRVERFLAEGGMSIVYTGRQLDMDREVVIKVMRNELASQPKAVAHFRREIHIMSRFEHPHAITFFDADAESRHPVLVMEFCRGLDLSQLLKEHQHFTVERAGRLMGQLCQVLHSAHEAGIVHQDLKPSNVMVRHPNTSVEKVKLMDFGLAKMSSLFYIDQQELGQPGDPVACGTPEYLSPEQAKGNDVDRRSDVYALGVILFEMLTGRRPFEGRAPEELLLAHVSDPPPLMAHLGMAGRIPGSVEKLVQECLAKYPEERPATAEELALRLEAALGKKLYSKKSGQSRGAGNASGGLSRSTMARLSQLDQIGDRNAVTCQVLATMPESMAMLKLKGFIHDVGGQVVSTAPGYVRVKLEMAVKAQKTGGMFGWLRGDTTPAPAPKGIDLELRVETEDRSRPNELSICMYLRSWSGRFDAEGKALCEQLTRDLQAYLR